MTKDLKIIGDNIEFMGYPVGTINDLAPPTVRDAFERALQRPAAPEWFGRKKGKRS